MTDDDAYFFAADITARARWARAHNDGHPNPAWSTGERLIVALVLGDQAALEAESYTREEAVRRLAGDLNFHGYTAGAAAWIAEVKAALDPAAGPYETEREAAAAVQHILALPPGTGQWQDAAEALMMGACANAGIHAGAYDSRILHWLAGWEPQTCAVIAGLITRASEAGKAATDA